MTVHRFPIRFLSAVISATLAGAFFAPAGHADPTTASPAGDAVQQPYYGAVNQDNVYVRSGPSDVFYATAKLNKGAKVTVVAVREPWLKIVPPDGSYCYVARAYVEKRGDGTVGRVTKSELNVRAGSNLNGLKTTVLTSLSEGDDVKIVGEQDEYFKIAPPPGAYLYIMKTYVDPLPSNVSDQPVPVVASAKTNEPIASAPIPPAVIAPAPVAAAPTVVAPLPLAPVTPATVSPVISAPIPAPSAAPTVVQPVISTTPAPTTQPVATAIAPTTEPSVAVAPATQPSEPSADEKFDTLETAFLEATSLPLDQQPLDKMLTDYTALSTDSSLPASIRRITDMRIATIKLRSDARAQYLEAQKLDAQAQARQTALKAEQQELQKRSKDEQVTIYTVLGTLRISSLQQSGATMYRVTDPATGRTLVYLRSNDPKYAGLLNQFIGVKGDITEDSNLNLKVIAPTAADVVDPAKVNTNVTATLMPPSLLPKTATASAGN